MLSSAVKVIKWQEWVDLEYPLGRSLGVRGRMTHETKPLKATMILQDVK